MSLLPPFPNPIDDRAARAIAGEVFALDLLAFGARQFWLLPIVAGDFVVRAVAGPRYSPLAIAARRWLAPRFGAEPQPTPGPPKRFAAAIGAVLMVSATILHRYSPNRRPLHAIGALMLLFPALESFFGLCVGCKAFSLLMRWGIVPEWVCEECANIELRRRRLASEGENAGS